MVKQHGNLEKSPLGRNTSRSRHKKFKKIRKKVGDTKKCPGYPLANYIDKWAVDNATKKVRLERKDFPLAWKAYKLEWPHHFDKGRFKTKANDESIPHIGKNPTDIQNFDLCTNAKDGLQAKCAACAYKWRKVRIAACRKRNEIVFEANGEKGIYDLYKIRYNLDTKKCSNESGISGTNIQKPVEDFSVSLSMETGLHNMCMSCAKDSSEATGSRWSIYNPDGYGSGNVSRKNKSCAWKEAGSERCIKRKKILHLDHQIPLQKGGSDHEINYMFLCDTHNLNKQAKIAISNIHNIDETMVCERYRKTLHRAQENNWTVRKFEDLIAKEVQKFILWKSRMSDEKLKEFFTSEKRKWNRKYDTDYHLKKFRKYCASRKNI